MKLTTKGPSVGRFPSTLVLASLAFNAPGNNRKYFPRREILLSLVLRFSTSCGIRALFNERQRVHPEKFIEITNDATSRISMLIRCNDAVVDATHADTRDSCPWIYLVTELTLSHLVAGTKGPEENRDRCHSERTKD